MPKRGESKYLGQRAGHLTVTGVGYDRCATARPGRRPTVNNFVLCLCDCGRSQRVPSRSFREGLWTRCEWCEMMAAGEGSAQRAFRESGERIDARERAALARLRPYRRPIDPDLFQFGRWMQ